MHSTLIQVCSILKQAASLAGVGNTPMEFQHYSQTTDKCKNVLMCRCNLEILICSVCVVGRLAISGGSCHTQLLPLGGILTRLINSF